MSGCSRWDEPDEEYEKEQRRKEEERKAKKEKAIQAYMKEMEGLDQAGRLKLKEAWRKEEREMEERKEQLSLKHSAFHKLCNHTNADGTSAVGGFEYNVCSHCGEMW